MARSEGVIWCDGCGVEISWSPYVVSSGTGLRKWEYCCEDCYLGYVCSCRQVAELEDERRSLQPSIWQDISDLV